MRKQRCTGQVMLVMNLSCPSVMSWSSRIVLLYTLYWIYWMLDAHREVKIDNELFVASLIVTYFIQKKLANHFYRCCFGAESPVVLLCHVCTSVRQHNNSRMRSLISFKFGMWVTMDQGKKSFDFQSQGYWTKSKIFNLLKVYIRVANLKALVKQITIQVCHNR